jgi:tetratricopeptide (TPR) repeat protein
MAQRSGRKQITVGPDSRSRTTSSPEAEVTKVKSRRQPQRLPPPIMRGEEAIDAEIVMREFPTALGVLLWKTARTVQLRAACGGAGAALFSPGAQGRRLELLARESVPDEVSGALAKAAAALQPRATPGRIASACREIALWAADQGKLGTAIEFMQAAAVTLPADAELALEVARLARTRAEYPRAETWYRQAISRARQAAAWADFSRSYIGLGSVGILRGNFPAARKALIRGLRAAKRFAIRPLVGAAYHELAVLSIQMEKAADLTRYAGAAAGAYGPGHPRLPALAFDCGVFLLSQGYFPEALRVFRNVPSSFGSAGDRLVLAAATVRAAAGAGDREAYDAAWSDASSRLEDATVAFAAPTALYSMATGAESAGDFDRAEDAALRVQALAGSLGDGQLQFAAAALLESVQRSRTVGAQREPARRAAPRIRELVEELEGALVGGGTS